MKKMALIQCPECGKEISNQAITCPNCGIPIASAIPSGLMENSPYATPSQPDSQKPVETVQIQRNNKNKSIIIVSVFVVILVAAIAIGIIINKQKAARSEYIENLASVRYAMLLGGADAEEACGMVYSVWYNTIYEKSDTETDVYTKWDSTYTALAGEFISDFNTSIANYYASEEGTKITTNIEANQEEVAALMKQLSNPTDEFSRCYDAISDLYDVYLRFTNLALEPGGYTLQTYSSTFTDLDDDFMTYYNKLETLIPTE